MKITEFCYKHHACREGFDWALSLGIETMEELWMREDMKPEWRLWIATRQGMLSDRELRLLTCWCVRQVWHLLADERSRNAVEVAERYASGESTEEDLSDAYAAARAAAHAYSGNFVAYLAASAAASAYSYAADVSASVAARAAYAYSVAADAADEAQVKYLIENTKPNFGGDNGVIDSIRDT